MEKQSQDGLRIHASIRPEPGKTEGQTDKKARRRRWPLQARWGRRSAKRRKPRLSPGDRLLRDTAIACALLLAVLTAQNIDQPWSRLALHGVESALTMRINLDESLGRLSFVRELVPESALVFLDLNARETFAPVEGAISHSFSEDQPWLAYSCAPGAEVRALEPGTVSAVTELSGGEWGLLLDHGGGVESVYAYLGAVQVQPGDTVSPGTVIGTASENGDISVYFEMREAGKAIDPAERLAL